MFALQFQLKSDNSVALVSAEAVTEMGDKGGRCVRLTTVQSLCACCLEIVGASTSRSPERLACKGPTLPLSDNSN
jgi:hypothetical protein